MSQYLGTGAYDIDGTLIHHDTKPDYLDPKSLDLGKPDRAICARVRTLLEVGMDVHFITGRAHTVRDATLAQLRLHVHPSIMPNRLHTKEAWTGYDDLAQWKAQVLSSVGAEWFVGDHEADERAARAAGIPFQHANAYHDASQAAPWAVV